MSTASAGAGAGEPCRGPCTDRLKCHCRHPRRMRHVTGSGTPGSPANTSRTVARTGRVRLPFQFRARILGKRTDVAGPGPLHRSLQRRFSARAGGRPLTFPLSRLNQFVPSAGRKRTAGRAQRNRQSPSRGESTTRTRARRIQAGIPGGASHVREHSSLRRRRRALCRTHSTRGGAGQQERSARDRPLRGSRTPPAHDHARQLRLRRVDAIAHGSDAERSPELGERIHGDRAERGHFIRVAAEESRPTEMGTLSEIVALHARYEDLVVAGGGKSADSTEDPHPELPADLVMTSGRPVPVVPPLGGDRGDRHASPGVLERGPRSRPRHP